MIKAYLNYPNSRVVAHTNVLCGDVQKMAKAKQRKISIDQNSFSVEIARFERNEHHFRSQSQFNDM